MQEMTIKGRKLRFIDEGRGFPVLFGHSFLFDHTMWRPQLDELKKSYRVIATDLFGHGQSDPSPEQNTTIKDIADDMWQLMKGLTIDRFAIMGLSIGGMWGVRMALDHPDNIAALGLFGSSVGAEPEARKREYFAMFESLQATGYFSAPFAEALLPFFYCPTTFALKKELPATLKASLMATKPENLPSILSMGHAIFARETWLHELHKLPCKTLVAVGKDDIARPAYESREMAVLLTRSEFHEIDQAGHISSLEQPAVVTKIIFDFLRHAVST